MDHINLRKYINIIMISSISFQILTTGLVLYLIFSMHAGQTGVEEAIRSIKNVETANAGDGGSNASESARSRALKSGLFSAYMLPHPPYNEGRTIRYDTFAKSKDENGREIVVFHEYRDGVYLQTQVPADQIKFSQPE